MPRTYKTKTNSLNYSLIETENTFTPIFNCETSPARRLYSLSPSNSAIYNQPITSYPILAEVQAVRAPASRGRTLFRFPGESLSLASLQDNAVKEPISPFFLELFLTFHTTTNLETFRLPKVLHALSLRTQHIRASTPNTSKLRILERHTSRT